MKRIFLIVSAFISMISCMKSNTQEAQKNKRKSFVTTNGTRFEIQGKPYRFMSANFWAGMNLGAASEPGNRGRLVRELDRMQKLGITNLRIIALTEGPDHEPYRIVPSNNDKGVLNEEVLEGLDYLLVEMSKRNMYAVVVLTNFWPWSGGMAQYLRWTHVLDSIHYPMDKSKAQDWNFFQKETAKFYSSNEAISMYIKSINQIIQRKNTISRVNYSDDPTIMSWELANEPRGSENIERYLTWIDETSKHIRSLDSNHLITVGSEGITGSPESSGVAFERAHAFKNIDYTCAHIWIQNWGWYDPKRHKETFPVARQKALEYLKHHAEVSMKLNKPYVLEEFGIMKDMGSYEHNASNQNRDEYYNLMFGKVYQYTKSDSMAGVGFWAWGGEGRPREAGSWWKPGDDFIGDPPHEEQGWYSIYDTDSSTHSIIQKYASLMGALK